MEEQQSKTPDPETKPSGEGGSKLSVSVEKPFERMKVELHPVGYVVWVNGEIVDVRNRLRDITFFEPEIPF